MSVRHCSLQMVLFAGYAELTPDQLRKLEL